MTDKYAVIGNPIAHSKSPLIHQMFAAQTGQDMVYEAIMAPLDGFAATIERLRLEGYRGCNITVPFKFEAFELSSTLSERAAAARAVNTLKFDHDAILGDNTDGAGLVCDIQRSMALPGRRVLLMGAGGAAYGVLLPLLHSGAKLTVVNRTVEKLQQLAAAFDAQISILSYQELEGRQFDCVINATSSSLSDAMPPLPASIFAPGALAYDMMYGRETPFMKFSRQHAAVVADGSGMLVEQAAEAFLLWRGVRPDTEPVLAAIRRR
jgi:shikimate dehydrogenase